VDETGDHVGMAGTPRRIVAGYDGSEGSLRALDAAAELVGYGSTLVVVSTSTRGPAHLRHLVDQARQRLLQRQVLARFVEVTGDLGDGVAEAVASLGADLVVLDRSMSTAVLDPATTVDHDILLVH